MEIAFGRSGRVEENVGREREVGIESSAEGRVDEERRPFETSSVGEIEEGDGRRRGTVDGIGEENAGGR